MGGRANISTSRNWLVLTVFASVSRSGSRCMRLALSGVMPA